MDVGKWNKAMESFQELLGWDYGMNVVLDLKRLTCGNQSIPDITGRDERRLIYKLRRTYDEVNKNKACIQKWRKDDTS